MVQGPMQKPGTGAAWLRGGLGVRKTNTKLLPKLRVVPKLPQLPGRTKLF